MKLRLVAACVFSVALATVAYGQDQNPPDNQNPAGQNNAEAGGQGPGGGGYGRGRRGGMGMMGMMDRGIAGTVTEVAADHYTIKSFTGETYTIHYSANTRMLKQPASGGRGYGGGYGGRRGEGGGNPPQQIKASDIKVGDSIAAMGDVDAQAKSVGAMMVMLLDPERARQMAQMEADYGKTWLMGKVTAINETKVTLAGGPDNAEHSFVADENTTFRRRRDPITLADIQVGDMVRVEGAVKNGVFTAATVNDMGVPGEARVPRNGPPSQQ